MFVMMICVEDIHGKMSIKISYSVKWYNLRGERYLSQRISFFIYWVSSCVCQVQRKYFLTDIPILFSGNTGFRFS